MSSLRTRVMLRDAIRLMLEKPEVITPGTVVKVPKKGDKGDKGGIDKSGGWVSWPTNAKKSTRYEAAAKGTGPGEARLAWMMGGKVMGGSVSHDIEGQDGSTWEVKEPTGGSIRAGTESTAATTGMRKSIENATSRIVRGITASRKNLDFRKLMSAEDYHTIETFIAEDAPMIMKAEIPPGRMDNMLKVLMIINSVIKNEVTKGGEEKDQKHLELGDQEHKIEKDIDLPTYVKVGQAADVPETELKVTDKELFAAAFNTPAFRDPQAWYEKTWKNGVKATDVFGHCDGVILVSHDGYRVILKGKLDKEMQFLGITQARAKFRVQ